MQGTQLLEYVAAEHRDEVERLYSAFVKTAGARAADSIDSFANALHVQGLLSAEGLKDFLTYHALTIRVSLAGLIVARHAPLQLGDVRAQGKDLRGGLR